MCHGTGKNEYGCVTETTRLSSCIMTKKYERLGGEYEKKAFNCIGDGNDNVSICMQ